MQLHDILFYTLESVTIFEEEVSTQKTVQTGFSQNYDDSPRYYEEASDSEDESKFQWH